MFPWILEAAGTVGLFASVNWNLGIFNSLLFPLLYGVFPFWNWYLWYCGALHTHRISRKKAALVIGIVIVLQVAYLFHLLFFSRTGPDM